jgi:hypothetical protein
MKQQNFIGVKWKKLYYSSGRTRILFVSGAWFDKEGVTKIVVYEYADKKSFDAAIKENDFMSEFEISGLFVLEISDHEIKTIFNDL